MEHITVWSVCSNGPTTMVHRGWQQNLGSTSEAKRLRRSNTMGSSKNPPTKRTKPSFMFVNTSLPNETRHNAQLKRSVREHARKHRYGKLDLPISTEISASSSIKEVKCSQRRYSSRQIQGIGHSLGIVTSLTTFIYPIQMSLQTHELLTIYLNGVSRRMLPSSISCKFSQNPLASPGWFQYAAHDETMLTAMLYSASVHLQLFGMLESRSSGTFRNIKTQMLFWHGRTLELVSKSVTSMGVGIEVRDSALGAVSCLAIAEAMIGNPEQWHVHMRGLRQLLLEYSRCSPKMGFGVPSVNESISIAMSRLSPTMRIKLCRSDLVGAVDYNSTPYLVDSVRSVNTLRRISHQHIWYILPQSTLAYISEQVSSLLLPFRASHFDSFLDLEETLKFLVYFVQSICPTSIINHTSRGRSGDASILDSHKFLDDLHALQFSLLTLPHATLKPSSSPLLDVQTALDKALRLSALLYLKYILNQPSTTAVGSEILLYQLREAMKALSLASDAISQTSTTAQLFDISDLRHCISSFCRWMGAIGALVASSETRGWFVTFLQRNFGKYTFQHEGSMSSSGGSSEKGLESLLSLDKVFGSKSLEALWSDVYLFHGETKESTNRPESDI